MLGRTLFAVVCLAVLVSTLAKAPVAALLLVLLMPGAFAWLALLKAKPLTQRRDALRKRVLVGLVLFAVGAGLMLASVLTGPGLEALELLTLIAGAPLAFVGWILTMQVSASLRLSDHVSGQ